MLGAISIDGIEALMTIEGGTTAAVFLKFVDEHLAPRLRPGDVVVMDNLGAHHAKGVRERSLPDLAAQRLGGRSRARAARGRGASP